MPIINSLNLSNRIFISPISKKTCEVGFSDEVRRNPSLCELATLFETASDVNILESSILDSACDAVVMREGNGNFFEVPKKDDHFLSYAPLFNIPAPASVICMFSFLQSGENKFIVEKAALFYDPATLDN